MKNDESIIGKLKYKHRFFFTLDYLLTKIGINFFEANIYSIELDKFENQKTKNGDVTIKVCDMNDLSKFGELKELFSTDMENGHIMVAAFSEDQWMGYHWISLKPIEVEEVERFINFEGAYLYRAYVKKEYRRTGIMNKMLDFSLNQIKNEYNKNEAYTITETANVPANKGLVRLNFSKIGRIKYSKIFSWKKFEEDIDNDSVTLVEN